MSYSVSIDSLPALTRISKRFRTSGADAVFEVFALALEIPIDTFVDKHKIRPTR